jgi:hypothetical protein
LVYCDSANFGCIGLDGGYIEIGFQDHLSIIFMADGFSMPQKSYWSREY